MNILQATLVNAVVDRHSRALKASVGPWKYDGNPSAAIVGDEPQRTIIACAFSYPDIICYHNARFVAANSPDVVIRGCEEDLWLLGRHNPDEQDLKAGLDPDCSCGSGLHRQCPYVLSMCRRYGMDPEDERFHQIVEEVLKRNDELFRRLAQGPPPDADTPYAVKEEDQ